MATRTYCDKCGDEILGDVYGQVETYIIHPTGAVASDVQEKDRDGMDISQKKFLCLKCLKEVQNLLKKKEPVPPLTPEKKHK